MTCTPPHSSYSQDLDAPARASPRSTMLPTNPSSSSKDGQSTEHPSFATSMPQPDHSEPTEGLEDSSYASRLDSYHQEHHPVFSDRHSDHPYRLRTSRSSESLASSINTVIHLTSCTISQPTPTSQTAQGSFLESPSDSSQLLANVAPQTKAQDPQGSSVDLHNPPDHSETRAPKIQFHQVVRISGGITSDPKRKKESQLQPKNIKIEQPRRQSIDQQLLNTSSPSPLRNSFVVNGSLDCSNQCDTSSSANSSAARPSRRGEVRRFDGRESSSSPLGRSLSNHRSNTLRPGPPSARSSFSHRSRNESMARSLPNSPEGISTPCATGLPRSYTRTTSMSSSFTGSGNLSTVISRSSSPASSLYLPLRVPVVRAPAPFFGPTPERVARVRERRLVAQRDAERAQGGWKAWWNNWYYHSDKVASQKGKARQGSTNTHDDQAGDPSHSVGCCDSDDGSCYHDVILEHERKKLERKLRKLQHSTTKIHQSRSKSHPHRRKTRPNSEKAPRTSSQSWFSWASSLLSRLPPPPVHPLRLPTPGAGILQPSKPNTQQINKQSCVPQSNSDSGYLITVEEVDSRTPLLIQPPQKMHDYGGVPPPQSSSSSSSPSSSSSGHTRHADPAISKTSTDELFGLAPQRWFKIRWWIWKAKRISCVCYLKIKNGLVDIFHVDWDTDRRYEGWENV